MMVDKNAGPPQGAGGISGEFLVSEDLVVPLLRDCADRHLPAMLLVPDLGVTFRARFGVVGAESFLLDMLEDASRILRPASGCFVALYLEQRAYVFYTRIHQYRLEKPPRLSRIVLAIPVQLMGKEMRQWFRVPIVPESGLHVRVTTDSGETACPTPLNIGLGGLLIEFQEDDNLYLPIGSELELELEFGEDKIQCRAEVRRRTGQAYGLCLENKALKGEMLQEFVSRLEREWLAYRTSKAEFDDTTG